MAKIKQIREGRQFHKLRPMRLDDETWELLKKHKKGTWNHFIKNIIEFYGDEKLRKVSGK